MDIVRTPGKSNKRYFIGGGVLVTVVGVTLALRNLEPAVPTVERGTLWIDSVQRGTMLRQVRAPGSLVPEQIRWVSALTAGRVERLPVRAGVSVTANTVLLELSNPDVQLQALDAQRQLAAAQAELVNLRTNLETQRLNQMGVVAQIRTEYNEARRNAGVQASLDSKGMTSANESGRARDRAVELEQRLEVEQDRLRILTAAMADQIRLQEAQVARMRAVAHSTRDAWRPAYGQAESVVSLFRLEPDGRNATRVSVKLGRGSVNTVEILQGLAVNDKVIISDMSPWDNVDRLRLR